MVRYDAVLFDLLTALLDSQSLWNSVAGSAEAGRRWRADYLQITYNTGAYRPYEELLVEAARAVGLEAHIAAALASRFGELEPWPEASPILARLVAAGLRVGVVTNCSRHLGAIAARRAGVE